MPAHVTNPAKRTKAASAENIEMNVNTDSFRIAFRVSDRQFVVRDAGGNDVFAGNYVEVESWLDQHENTASEPRQEEPVGDVETEAAAELLKATMLTQEMIHQALATEPKQEMKPKTRRPRLRRRLLSWK